MNPKVTVLMPVYNGQRYLPEAMESILGQTFTDFEFLILNDGSTDSSREIICSFDDSRVRFVDNPTNMGLAKSLNSGLKISEGELIARQDADDISLPNRLERQVAYFNDHPDLGLLGTWAEAIEERGRVLWKICPPAAPSLLKWRMLFKNNIIHTSVMFNKEKVIKLGGYNSNIAFAQDYDLWTRIMMRYEIAQLPEVLIHLRDHSDHITAKHLRDQKESENHSVHRNIQHLLQNEISLEDSEALGLTIEDRPITNPMQLKRAADLLQDLYAIALKQWSFDSESVTIITKDYAQMMKTIASKHINMRRKGSLCILQKALQTDSGAIFQISTIRCILKWILGPRVISKFQKLVNLL
jgi:hypothetical protein